MDKYIIIEIKKKKRGKENFYSEIILDYTNLTMSPAMKKVLKKIYAHRIGKIYAYKVSKKPILIK